MWTHVIFTFSAHSSRSRLSEWATRDRNAGKQKSNPTGHTGCEYNCRSSLINMKRTRFRPPVMSVTLRVVWKSFQRFTGAGGRLLSYSFFIIWTRWRFVHDKFERVWKEAVVVLSKHYHCICLEGPRETTKNLNQESRCSKQNSNQVFPNTRLGPHRYVILPLASSCR
jgi:hypothetical protein